MRSEYEYAKDIATHLWESNYKSNSPEWEPCDDLMGVLSQIDNMTTGLTIQTKKKVPVLMEHKDSQDCWCEPYLDYEDPETGNQVWVHRERH